MIIHSGGVDIFYQKSGSGHPLILLHGNGLDHSMFDEITEKLQSHYTVYAMDIRNHGQSGTTTDYSYVSMAKDVNTLVQELKLGKVYLLGFSDGAVIALHVALAHLDILEKVAFLGLNLKPSDLREKSLNYFRRNYEETGELRFKIVLDTPNIELEELKAITIPTLLMAAEREIFRDDLFEEMAGAFPNLFKAKIVEGHHHESYMVHNDLLYPDLLEFFG